MTWAQRDGSGGWRASGPRPVPEPVAFVEDLFALAGRGPTLAAFDFPIGLPARYGAGTGFGSFSEMLDALGRGAWPEFFAVAATPDDIGPRRPFYPNRPGGARLRHLLDGHGVADVGALTRLCERGGAGSKAAGCMFWTMGAQQVGKAMLHGWREVVLPARARGARLWPFDGDLSGLADGGGLVLAESYPGDAYGRLGFSFRGKSKGRIADRAGFGPHLLDWATGRAVAPDEHLVAALRNGFPPRMGNDDGFDALVGLLAAIAVARGEHRAAPRLGEALRLWEGWILGKREAAWDPFGN